MPSKQRIRLTFNRNAYSRGERYGRRISNQQTSRSCTSTPPHDYNNPSSYCRTRLSHSPPGPLIASEVVYRSPFRSRIAPERSPKRQKLISAQPTKKSLLVVELFVFLTAYTTLSEEQRLGIVEKVFDDVDWEECADVDEGKGDGLGDLYGLDDRNDGGLGQVCRWILELSEAGIATAFGELVSRITEGGWRVDGILIPPVVETGAKLHNWTVGYDNTGLTVPITYQAVSELVLLQMPLYDRDPMDPQIVAERAEYLQNYLERCSAEDLEQSRLDKEKTITAHLNARKEKENEARERYWQLVGERASLALAGETRDSNSSMFSGMASAVSTADLSSIQSSNSATALNRTQIDDWAFNCTSDGANSKAPLLEPFPPFTRSESPKRKAADAGFGDQWGFGGDVPTDADEEERMMQHALRASMRVSTKKSPSPSIDSAVHWEHVEDSNKVPWLDSRFRGSIFYNNLPTGPFPFPQSEEPLIVRQAIVDLGSGSEPPPPPKNNKLPAEGPVEYMDMVVDELKEERAKLESTVSETSKELGDSEMRNQGIETEAMDKGEGQRRAQNMPDRRTRHMRGVFRDLRAMSEDLNRSSAFRAQEQGKVVTGTVEEARLPNAGSGELAEPVTKDVNNIVRNSTEEARDIELMYPGFDISNPEGPTSVERLAKAFADHYRAQALGLEKPTMSMTPEVIADPIERTLALCGLDAPLPEKKRNIVLERIAYEESKPRKSDKLRIVDFADRAENKPAFHRAKAAGEADPASLPPPKEPDLRHFMPGPKAMESLRRSEERNREKQKAEERKLKGSSEGGRPKRAIESLIPPDTPEPPGPSTPTKCQVPIDSGASGTPPVPAEPGTPADNPVCGGTGAPTGPGDTIEPGKTAEPGTPVGPEKSTVPGKPTENLQVGDPDSDEGRRRRKRWLCC